jgi:hypothetical protein
MQLFANGSFHVLRGRTHMLLAPTLATHPYKGLASIIANRPAPRTE